MTFQNFQNLHFTNWHRVLDIIFWNFILSVEYSNFYGNFVLVRIIMGSYQRFLGNSTEGLAKLFLCGVSGTRNQAKFLYFLEWFCLFLPLLFYLVQDSSLRLAIGYFYCIFRYIFLLAVNFE